MDLFRWWRGAARILREPAPTGVDWRECGSSFALHGAPSRIHTFGERLSALGREARLVGGLSSPTTVGHLATFDPANGAVIAWWQHKVDEIYQLIPDFAGFTVKADSEGPAGPSRYGRTPADAANTLARALRPHGGIVLYRGFVYNHHPDWRDAKADRARAGYDNFASLDGKFAPNVVIQIKHGPIDFRPPCFFSFLWHLHARRRSCRRAVREAPTCRLQ
jgi:alpha-glucuronidase